MTELFGMTSNLSSRLPPTHFALPRLVKDMRRHTLHLYPDGFHRSTFAFLSSVFANCVVFPFFPFPLTAHAVKLKLHHAEGKSGCIRTHKALQENQGPTAERVSSQQENEVFIREENLMSQKGHSWHR